jgi:hypothetical protein
MAIVGLMRSPRSARRCPKVRSHLRRSTNTAKLKAARQILSVTSDRDSGERNPSASDAAAPRRSRCHAALVDLRFFAMLSEIPVFVAFCRVAPGVRLNAFAIFVTGSLRAIVFRVRRSSLVHGRLGDGFLVRTETFLILLSLNVRLHRCEVR